MVDMGKEWKEGLMKNDVLDHVEDVASEGIAAIKTAPYDAQGVLRWVDNEKFQAFLKGFAGTLAVVLLVGGCAEYRAVGRTVAAESVQAKREINDGQRDLNTVLLCETTTGAFWRSQNPRQRAAISCACGGPCPILDDETLLRLRSNLNSVAP